MSEPVKIAVKGMKQADGRLVTSAVGSDIPLRGVTPAEVLILVADHQKNSGKQPVTITKELPPVERSVGDEIDRLCAKYGAKKVRTVFQGAIPTLPETFEEAIKVGLQTTTTGAKLLDFKV